MTARQLFLITLFSIASAALADTCPNLNQDNPCTGSSAGSTCDGWLVAQGTITPQSAFSKILTRNNFPFTVTCQYNAGSLSLFKLKQAVPSTPYLWTIQSIGGLTFTVCVLSRESCSFTLIG